MGCGPMKPGFRWPRHRWRRSPAAPVVRGPSCQRLGGMAVPLPQVSVPEEILRSIHLSCSNHVCHCLRESPEETCPFEEQHVFHYISYISWTDRYGRADEQMDEIE